MPPPPRGDNVVSLPLGALSPPQAPSPPPLLGHPVPPLDHSALNNISSLLNILNAATTIINSRVGGASQASATQPATGSAEPTLPVFVPGPQTHDSKSIPDLYPLVETSILLSIAKHKFQPHDLYKPDPNLHIKDKQMTLDMEDGHVVLKNTFMNIKEYPSPTSVLAPLTVYFNILSTFALFSNKVPAIYTILKGSMVYTQHLLNLYGLYNWPTVLQYHSVFHLCQRREMTSGNYAGWAGVNEDFQSKYLQSHEKTQSTKQKGLGVPSSSHTGTSCSTAMQVCFNFKWGTCTQAPCPVGCLHKCCFCRSSEHGTSSVDQCKGA